MPEERQLLQTVLRQHPILAEIMPSLLRLVAEGRPVPLDRLASQSGRPAEEIESWLRSQPGTDWDEQGRLIGFGLTQRPTPHRYVMDGRVLYGFCAADTLLFPAVFGRSAEVRSTCPATGEAITMRVTLDSVEDLQPETAVVSEALPTQSCADIRADLCDHGHFYASEESAESWKRDHPGGSVTPVADYLARRLPELRDLAWLA